MKEKKTSALVPNLFLLTFCHNGVPTVIALKSPFMPTPKIYHAQSYEADALDPATL